MPFTIIRQDITKMQVDAVVNAANTALKMGGGVCGAIFRAAGVEKLQRACDGVAPVPTGQAAITPGFDLPAKYVIHAVGPVYDPGDREGSEALLRSAYLASLKLARAHRCGSIAFPLISSGIYGYPKAGALEVAAGAIREFLSEYDMDVYLAVFDKTAFRVSEALLGEVESYIDENYVEAHEIRRRRLIQVDGLSVQAAAAPKANAPAASMAPKAAFMPPAGIDELMLTLDEPFSDTLLKLIDRKGKTDVEVYKKANIDRKLFSKIRTGKGYTPKKPTILALAIALELTLRETDDLLKRAGYALSHASKFDVIVEFFILKGNYNIYEINEVLFQYDLPLLGA